METLQSLSHSRWDCKFHVVWIPKCRKKTLYGPLRKELGAVFHELARQKECQVILVLTDFVVIRSLLD